MLTFDNVSAELGADLDLTALSLQLAAGSCVAVRGPTLARAAFADLMLGLREPDAGRVDFDGADWAQLPLASSAARRARIGCALDRPNFLSNLDVAENLVLAERLQHGRRAKAVLAEAEALASKLGFGAIPDCRPHGLDRLQAHRLAILRALLGDRRLLLLEVVAGALDEAAVAALAAELAARRQLGAAVVWLSANRAPLPLQPVATLDLTGHREDAA